jgi:hypothetical protein
VRWRIAVLIDCGKNSRVAIPSVWNGTEDLLCAEQPQTQPVFVIFCETDGLKDAIVICVREPVESSP